MKKYIQLLSLLLVSINLNAQLTQKMDNSEKENDLFRLSITPIVPEEFSEIPESAKTVLENRMLNLITSAGLGGFDYEGQFLMVAKPIIINKKTVSTAPVFIQNEIEVSLFIVDAFNKKVFASTNISLNSIGKTENESYSNAFKNINFNNPEIKIFLTNGKNKIIDYYNLNCNIFIKKANLLEANGNLEEALSLLATVPEVCEVCFSKVITETEKIYAKNIDRQCSIILKNANVSWNTNPTYEGAQIAGQYLGIIPTWAKCYPEVSTLINDIRKKLTDVEVRDWDFEMKKWNDRVSIQKQYIGAIQAVGVAYGNNQPQKSIEFRGWLW